jgi:uncharacterized protein YdcH (DUF465 family)
MASAGERASHVDPKYSRLLKKHGEYDRRLKELQSQRYLSDEEKLEEVWLKKMKLALKDQMEAMLQAGSR